MKNWKFVADILLGCHTYPVSNKKRFIKNGLVTLQKVMREEHKIKRKSKKRVL